MSSTRCTRSGNQYYLTHRERVYKQPITRKPKTRKTTRAQKIINDKVRLKSQIQVVDENFSSSDSCFFTCTFEGSSPTYDVAKRTFSNFCRRLKRAIPGVRYSAVYHEGEKTKRPHFHVFLSCKDQDVIESIWDEGVVHVSHLWSDSQEDTVYYMFNGAKIVPNHSVFINSRNLVKPVTFEIQDIKYEDISAVLDKMSEDAIVNYNAGSNSLLGQYMSVTCDSATFDFVCIKHGIVNPFTGFSEDSFGQLSLPLGLFLDTKNVDEGFF